MTGPDRPRNAPEDRVVYLPVRVMYEGLYDETNGPYFKGSTAMSPAYGPNVWSISESQVLTAEQVAATIGDES